MLPNIRRNYSYPIFEESKVSLKIEQIFPCFSKTDEKFAFYRGNFTTVENPLFFASEVEMFYKGYNIFVIKC